MNVNFSVLAEFQELTKNPLDSKEKSSVKILKKTVKSLENILKAIDKFLKSKNIDVGKAYEQTKDKGKSIIDSTKKLYEESKQKGIKNFITEKATNVKSKLGEMYSGDTEKEAGPPEAEKDKQTSTLDKIVDRLDKIISKEKITELKESLTEKTTSGSNKLKELKDKVVDKLTPSGVVEEPKKGWFDKLKERQDKRKAEVEEEKKSVIDRLKGKKSNSWLGSILSAVGALGGFVVKGLSKVLSFGFGAMIKSVKFLGGFLFKGFSKTLFSLVPSLSGGIAKSLQSVIGAGLRGAGSLAWAGVKGAAKAALPLAGKVGGMLLRGAGMLATGPVGWAVAIGTAVYAGYKLYKYLKRNDISTDIYGKLTRLRLLMYGINDTNKEYYSKIFDLEMIMKDYIKFSNYKVEINKLDGSAIEKIIDIFGITKEEKDKYNILNTWFMKRFIPSYKAFMQALYSVNSNIYLDDIDKLKPLDLVDFITKFNLPTNIYNITQAPTFNTSTDILVRKEDVDAMYISISNDIKSKAPKEKSTEEKIKENAKQQIAKQEAAKIVTNAVKPENKTDINTPKQQPIPNKPLPAPDAEGENKPTIKEEIAKTETKASGKLNKASGELSPGGMSLEGISTKLNKEKIYNLDPNVRELFTGMAKEYKTLTGKDIPVNEAFRSYEDQKALYERMPEKAAKPGNSTHEYGLAIDIASETSQELDKMGLLRKYGFSTSIGREKWHIEPIGVTLNPTLAKKDPNFRLKAIESSPGNGGGGYGFLDNSVLKKRDTSYQLSIYNSNSDNPIDVNKVAKATMDKENSLKSNKTGIDTSGKIKDTAISNTTNVSSNSTTKENINTSSINNTVSNTSNTSNVAVNNNSITSQTTNSDTEGENKPSIPKTTSPIKKKEDIPSLENNTSSVPSTGQNLDLGKYVELPPVPAIKQAAKMTGMDEDTMITFAKMESSMNPNAKAKTSSASGLFQLTDATWEEQLKKSGSKYGIPKDADKENPFYNSLMASDYAKKNLSKLNGWQNAGIAEETALYLTHFLGPSGANKFVNQLNKDPKAPIQTAVSGDSYKANYSMMKDKTVEGLVSTIDSKINKAAGAPVASYTPKENKINTTSEVETKPIMNASLTTKPDLSSKPQDVKPSISNTRYDVTSSTTASSNSGINKDTSASTQPYKEMFKTDKMENIMSEQLTTLTQIATILTSIDSKFDLNKLKDLAPSNKSTPPAIDKSIPPSSVDLSRKKII